MKAQEGPNRMPLLVQERVREAELEATESFLSLLNAKCSRLDELEQDCQRKGLRLGAESAGQQPELSSS